MDTKSQKHKKMIQNFWTEIKIAPQKKNVVENVRFITYGLNYNTHIAFKIINIFLVRSCTYHEWNFKFTITHIKCRAFIVLTTAVDDRLTWTNGNRTDHITRSLQQQTVFSLLLLFFALRVCVCSPYHLDTLISAGSATSALLLYILRCIQ